MSVSFYMKTKDQFGLLMMTVCSGNGVIHVSFILYNRVYKLLKDGEIRETGGRCFRQKTGKGRLYGYFTRNLSPTRMV